MVGVGTVVNPGRHERINGACLLKTGSVEAEETWTGSLSQTSDAVGGKNLEVAIDVFLNCADMVVVEDLRDREGII